MKRLKSLEAMLIIGVLAIVAACATTAAPSQQQFITTATQATQLVDQVALAADAAVKSGVLKGQDAQNTLTAITTARDALVVAKSLGDPAQGIGKVQMTLAILTATQTYLATLGAKP